MQSVQLVFLINWMPSSVLVGNIPYSVVFPNKSLFPVEPKVFESTCYAQDIRPSVTKLDPKALNVFSLAILDFRRDISVILLNLENFGVK